jgi:hypothetical protein
MVNRRYHAVHPQDAVASTTSETGGTIMRFWFAYALVLGLCLWAGPAVAQNPDKEAAGAAAAEQWLSLVDAGHYGRSWKGAAEYFQNAIGKEKWVQSLKAVRSPLGAIVSRQVKSTAYRTALPGAPDGEYVVVQFTTSFENKRSAIETVTPMLEKDGQWRVSGYFIK